ncbi:hypothetical protein [Yersinia rohdei]|nr:hypothetical protein [Yersinia rohdei]
MHVIQLVFLQCNGDINTFCGARKKQQQQLSNNINLLFLFLSMVVLAGYW